MSKKINPWSLKRPERPQETRSFTDPLQPGVEVALTLRPLDAPGWAVAMERADELITLYVTGDPDEGIEPSLYPAPNGEPLKLARRVCRNVAALHLMQAGPKDEQYTESELIALMASMPTAWTEILTWSAELETKYGKQAGNASGAGEGTSSAPPSATTSRTPRSPRRRSGSSGASTSG